jgi:hypothetical protein
MEKAPSPTLPRFAGEGAPAHPKAKRTKKQVSPSPGEGVKGGAGEGAGG